MTGMVVGLAEPRLRATTPRCPKPAVRRIRLVDPVLGDIDVGFERVLSLFQELQASANGAPGGEDREGRE